MRYDEVAALLESGFQDESRTYTFDTEKIAVLKIPGVDKTPDREDRVSDRVSNPDDELPDHAQDA